MPGILLYSNNNSGGKWWLSTEDYERLEHAGWNIHWAHRSANSALSVQSRVYNKEELLTPIEHTDLKYMGASAVSCAKRFNSAQEGIAEWERISKQCATEVGCPCCGPPHGFEWYDDDGSRKYIHTEVTSHGELTGF